MGFLLFLRPKKQFHGQLFLLYLMLYAVGRFVLEYFRGDEARGFIIGDYLSNSQFIALILLGVTLWVYRRWSFKNRLAR
jgi:phosphatidylglycerol:prolipoprotein diacylglycerol transferase